MTQKHVQTEDSRDRDATFEFVLELTDKALEYVRYTWQQFSDIRRLTEQLPRIGYQI